MRKSVVRQEQFPKKDLLRIVLTPKNTVEIDETGRKNGRGAYLAKRLDIIEAAKKTRALDRALKTKVDDSFYDELFEYFK